jgi:hypothetical protein
MRLWLEDWIFFFYTLITPQVCQPRERASEKDIKKLSYFFASRIGMRQKEKRGSPASALAVNTR